MIKKLKLKNFHSIYDESSISFEKSKLTYRTDYVLSDYNIVNPVVFYGYNASGKTSILEGFKFIYGIMHRDVLNEVNEDLFIYNKYLSNLNEEVVIELEFMVGSREYVYKIVGTQIDEIVCENLYYKGVDLLSEYREKLYSKKQSLLRLAVSSNLNDKHIKSVYKFLSNIHYMTLEGSLSSSINSGVIDIIRENEAKVMSIMSELGEFINISFHIERDSTDQKVLMFYEVEDKYKNNPKDQPNKIVLNVDKYMSNGSKKLYKLLSFLFTVNNGSVVVVDEIENMIHPKTLKKLFLIFNKYFDIQLVVSSHNTSLMKELRPDQLYLVSRKSKNTSVSRVNVNNPKIRENQNMEKMYFEDILK